MPSKYWKNASNFLLGSFVRRHRKDPTCLTDVTYVWKFNSSNLLPLLIRRRLAFKTSNAWSDCKAINFKKPHVYLKYKITISCIRKFVLLVFFPSLWNESWQSKFQTCTLYKEIERETDRGRERQTAGKRVGGETERGWKGEKWLVPEPTSSVRQILLLAKEKDGESKLSGTYYNHQKPKLTRIKLFPKELKVGCFQAYGLSTLWCHLLGGLRQYGFTGASFPLVKLQPKKDQRITPPPLTHMLNPSCEAVSLSALLRHSLIGDQVNPCT